MVMYLCVRDIDATFLTNFLLELGTVPTVWSLLFYFIVVYFYLM